MRINVFFYLDLDDTMLLLLKVEPQSLYFPSFHRGPAEHIFLYSVFFYFEKTVQKELNSKIGLLGYLIKI